MIFAYRVSGREHIPTQGAVIFCCNHLSYLDPCIMAPGVGLNGPHVYFMGRSTLFKNFFFRQLISNLKCFPVNRGGADRQSWRTFAQLITEGKRILLFPEGTRSSDGELQKAAIGSGMLVHPCKTAVIIPVRIFGAEKVWPKGKGLQGRFPLGVTFGPSIDLSEEFKKEGSRDVYRAIGEKVMAGIKKLESPYS